MTEQVANLNIQEDVLSLRIENKALREVIIDLEAQIEKMKQDAEWHYVKDGDYPKDNKPVFCILGDVDSESYEVGYYNDVGSGEPWHFETYHLPDDDGDNAWGVSAWQKITPPKVK